MISVSTSKLLPLSLLPPAIAASQNRPCLPLCLSGMKLTTLSRYLGPPKSCIICSASSTLFDNSVSPRNGVYTVGDFMTNKEDLHVVKPTTTVDEALEMLVENRITGFPVIDDYWKLVGLVSDYDLLALDSISGSGRTDTNMFPEVDSTWKDRETIARQMNVKFAWKEKSKDSIAY